MAQPKPFLLKQPTISAEHVAFLYAGELWVAGRDGSHPRRLTAQKGRKVAPVFSPDGQWIAFSGDYDGNLSVYVIPVEGGSPTRLTYHPYPDLCVAGRRMANPSCFPLRLNRLPRASASCTRCRWRAVCRLSFPCPWQNGAPSLPKPNPDGSPCYLAYTAYAEAFWSWKRYRGGMTLPIWVLDLATYDHVVIPHENASDTFPCWLGKEFTSSRTGPGR